VIDAPVDAVWDLVSDPYHLPRWWPRTQRVESVRKAKGGRRTHWTKVLETEAGRGVRADFRCTSSARNERYVWEQQLGDTPFDKVLRSSVTELKLDPRNGSTAVTLTVRQRLRGLSRLGSPMMRRGTRRTVNDALDGIERALLGGADEAAGA
jgi:uncharacterized protein YndB with AHSA1/START domain